MADKKRTYEANVMALPPLRMVLGEVPSPDPVVRRKGNDARKSDQDLQVNVKKLIAHLSDSK